MNEICSFLKGKRCIFGVLTVVIIGVIPVTGCTSFKPNRRTAIHRVKAKQHDTELAKSLHGKAVDALENSRWDKAEHWVNQAILADSNFGPAHNTLGTIFYQNEQLYHAAWAFEKASSLMPDNCEPFNNLGLVYEKAGKYQEAYNYYLQGLDVSPGNAELSGNVARIRIILDERGEDLNLLLSDLALVHPQKQWRSWARYQSEIRRFNTMEVWNFSNGDAALKLAPAPRLENAKTGLYENSVNSLPSN